MNWLPLRLATFGVIALCASLWTPWYRSVQLRDVGANTGLERLYGAVEVLRGPWQLGGGAAPELAPLVLVGLVPALVGAGVGTGARRLGAALGLAVGGASAAWIGLRLWLTDWFGGGYFDPDVRFQGVVLGGGWLALVGVACVGLGAVGGLWRVLRGGAPGRQG